MTITTTNGPSAHLSTGAIIISSSIYAASNSLSSAIRRRSNPATTFPPALSPLLELSSRLRELPCVQVLQESQVREGPAPALKEKSTSQSNSSCVRPGSVTSRLTASATCLTLASSHASA